LAGLPGQAALRDRTRELPCGSWIAARTRMDHKDADVFHQAPCAGRARDYRASHFGGVWPGGDQRFATLIIRIAASSAK
jgi:hypothetical protein